MADNWHNRWKGEHGDFAVPCMVSNRWLEFSRQGTKRFHDGEYIQLTVMTSDAQEKPKKLCGLIVTREDLLSVLDLIEKAPR